MFDTMKKSRIARGVVFCSILGLASFGGPSVTNAYAGSDSADYPPPPPPESSLDVSAFAPVCQNDAPFIEYEIVPVGFESTGPATLTFFDVNGNFVETVTVDSLSGRVIYPGASIGADGNATDWPGWKFENGSWVPDASDSILRDGLSVRVEVNPTATATVSYPPASSGCDGPNDLECAASDPGCGTLPQTGGPGVSQILLLGGAALVAGLMITAAAGRRRDAALPA